MFDGKSLADEDDTITIDLFRLYTFFAFCFYSVSVYLLLMDGQQWCTSQFGQNIECNYSIWRWTKIPFHGHSKLCTILDKILNLNENELVHRLMADEPLRRNVNELSRCCCCCWSFSKSIVRGTQFSESCMHTGFCAGIARTRAHSISVSERQCKSVRGMCSPCTFNMALWRFEPPKWQITMEKSAIAVLILVLCCYPNGQNCKI